ncbi:MAG: FAD-binding oxidoreductase [Bradyrhizobiaceae bacterium]|nr:FAD-binding oxidoreductase [Bradyrhizobiaceae bacterium]
MISANNPSFWDSDAQLEWHADNEEASKNADVAIIGGGLLGSIIARQLHQREPELRCVVIERGKRPYGASTRNAGFACYGSLGEVVSDIDRLGKQGAKDLVARRVDGLQKLRSMVGNDAQVGFEVTGGHEVYLSDDPALERIEEVNALLAPIFPDVPYVLRDDLIAANGLSNRVQHLVYTPYEGMLHSGHLLQALEPNTIVRGTVVGIERHATQDAQERWTLSIESSVDGVAMRSTMHVPRVIVATNAWLPELVPSLAVEPGRGQMLITKPLANLALRGTFHMRAGFVYFRNVGNRVMLGGGRMVAFDEERTFSMDTTPIIQDYLHEILTTIILPDQHVDIDARWSGTMAFTPDHLPFIKQVSDGLWAAMTCNGMGVALASNIASEVAAVVLQDVAST